MKGSRHTEWRFSGLTRSTRGESLLLDALKSIHSKVFRLSVHFCSITTQTPKPPTEGMGDSSEWRSPDTLYLDSTFRRFCGTFEQF